MPVPRHASFSNIIYRGLECWFNVCPYFQSIKDRQVLKLEFRKHYHSNELNPSFSTQLWMMMIMFHMVIISIIRAFILWLFVWSRNEKLVILPSCICLLRYFHATFRTIKIILLIYHAREFKTLSTDYRQLRHNSAVSVSFWLIAPLIPGAARGGEGCDGA